MPQLKATPSRGGVEFLRGIFTEVQDGRLVYADDGLPIRYV